VFRLKSHIRRLFDSAKVYRIPIKFSQDEIQLACRQVVLDNGLGSAYIRPLVFRGCGSLGVLPSASHPVDVVIIGINWGNYLGEAGLRDGIDVCVSSWHRMTSASNPILSKAGGHYLNSQLIANDARRSNCVEAIVVNADGTISEGSAENVFVVRDGVLYTPPLSASILGGITRDSVITLARHLKIETVERNLPRDYLYIADEIFLTGTAAEVTPVRSVDGLPVGAGKPGEITKQIQRTFFGLFDGRTPDEWNWLTAV
jgi:branched-chain amino acid aminotransferase